MAGCVYTPLKRWQSRVLKLHPGAGDHPLTGDLMVANIMDMDGLVLRDTDERVCYEAISYAWGAPSFDEVIYLNGSKAGITPSLSGALTLFRKTDVPRYLWAGMHGSIQR